MQFVAFVNAKATEDMKLEVLGAPFGGPINGKDKQGEYFSPNTDFQLEIGDRRPVNYYHGVGPNKKPQRKPERVGWATAIRKDSKGLWFEVELEEDKPLARRLWDKAKKGAVKASSGAIDYLIRKKSDGELLTWVIGELSLLDEGFGRVPVNDFAIAQPIKAFKANFEDGDIPLPEGVLETEKVKSTSEERGIHQEVDTNTTTYGGTSTMEMTEDRLEELLSDAALEGAKALREQMDAEAEAEREEQELREQIRTEEREKLEDELADRVPNWKSTFNVKDTTELGSETKEDTFLHWIRSGDTVPAMKAGVEAVNAKAMEEGVGAEGGFIVPDDFEGKINERRNRMSFPRQMGVQVFQTSRDVLDIPVEDEAIGRFTLTGEESAYNDTDYDLGEVAVTVHKFTNLTKVSEELLADEAANLGEWLSNQLARRVALTENYFVSVGGGTTEPEGIFTGGDTDALTFDTGSTIAAKEIPELYGKLDPAYRDDVVWLMHSSTEAHLAGLRDANEWAFSRALGLTVNGQGTPTLWNHPYFVQDDIPELTDNAGVIAVGNPQYYALVERQGLVVTRNPYLYEENGQVGIFARLRFGGAVLQEEAFKIGVTAA